MRKCGIILLIAALITGVFGYLKIGVNITYLDKVNATVISTEKSSVGGSNRIKKGTSGGTRSGKTYYYVNFSYTDENGFEQQVEQNVPSDLYSFYSSMDENDVREYCLYESGDGYYLTRESGNDAVKEYRRAHSFFIHSLSEMVSFLCLLIGGFLLWLSFSPKRSGNKKPE